jgi:small subunit ribosomal protein S11
MKSFSTFPQLRLLCSHCRQRLRSLNANSNPNPPKRLLTTGRANSSTSLNERILSNLDELDQPSSSSDFKISASKLLGSLGNQRSDSSTHFGSLEPSDPSEPQKESMFKNCPEPPPHHLHVYATKHNCHITLSDGKRQPLISVSSGNIGFRKAARGSYDAGYQLGAYVMGRIQQQGLLKQIHAMEVILRDFGPGREAFTKILLGNEGRAVRGTVVRVMDATRLKFGGTRSKKPRRLG